MTKLAAPTTIETDPQRSAQMALVRGSDTQPELAVRRALHKAGLRYRLHAKDLPGRPDIVFRSRRLVVFVHGCFWHRHDDSACKLARLPKSRQGFWEPKLRANVERDERNIRSLRSDGWRVEVIWECQLKTSNVLDELVQRIATCAPKPAKMLRHVKQAFTSGSVYRGSRSSKRGSQGVE